MELATKLKNELDGFGCWGADFWKKWVDEIALNC